MIRACSHCDEPFDLVDGEAVVPYHDFPKPCRAVCPGAKKPPVVREQKEGERVPCRHQKRYAACDMTPGGMCFAVPPDMPGLRCMKYWGHRGQHEGQGRKWGEVEVVPANAARPERRRQNTAAAVLAMASLFMPPDIGIPSRRR